MVKLSQLPLDAEKVEKGVPFEHAGIVWWLRPHDEQFELMMIQQLQKMGVATLNEATDEQIGNASAYAIANRLLTDWENVEDDNGDPQPYNPIIAFACLRVDGNKDIRMKLLAASKVRGRYMAEVADTAAKN